MDRDHDLHDLATILRLTARSPAEEAYFRGYLSGVTRRIAGGIGANEKEAVAFDLLRDAPDGLAQFLGNGYKDGLAGEPLKGRSSR